MDDLKGVNREDTDELRMRDELEVLKLDYWEREYIVEKDDKMDMNLSKSERQSMNYLSEIKKSIDKIDLKNASKQLIEFYKRTEQEQGTILIQNINLQKKKFNFDVFNQSTAHKVRKSLLFDKRPHGNKEFVRRDTYNPFFIKTNPVHEETAKKLHELKASLTMII